MDILPASTGLGGRGFEDMDLADRLSAGRAVEDEYPLLFRSLDAEQLADRGIQGMEDALRGEGATNEKIAEIRERLFGKETLAT